MKQPLLLPPAPPEIVAAYYAEQRRAALQQALASFHQAVKRISERIGAMIDGLIEALRVWREKFATVFRDWIEKVITAHHRGIISYTLARWGMPRKAAAWIARRVPKWCLPTIAHVMEEST